MTAKHTRATARALMQSEYARNKRELMGLVNQIRSTGAAVEIEWVMFLICLCYHLI